MYRQSNERYSQNNQINPLPNYPHPSMSKMLIDNFNPPPPMPMYYDGGPPAYDYQQGNGSQPVAQNFDGRYMNWRDVSQPKPSVMMTNLSTPIGNLPQHYDVRQPLHHQFSSQPKSNQNFPSTPVTQMQQQQQQQVNVVQRISGIIKSQLTFLQSTMIYADRKTQQQKSKKERSRSRSRQRERDRGRRHSRQRQHKQHREWNCLKCSFLNFDFRDRCKRCNDPKPQQRSEKMQIGGGKNYVPGPDDWRCSKCGNINYARRLQCHRCRTSRNK